MKPPDLRGRTRPLAAALFWSCIGLLFALPMLGDRTNWQTPVLASLTQWWAWGLLAPLIIALDRRLPFTSAQVAGRLGAHLVLGALVTLLHVYLQALLAALLGMTSWERLGNLSELDGAGSGGILWAMLVYFLILGGWWALQSHRLQMAAELRMERMERNYTEARLNALRLQLDPHFLFNTLNTISAQVQAEPQLARQMIEHLGDLLRLSLDPKSRDEIALADELAFLELYLSIQKIRFGDRLRVTLHIAPDALHAAVPSLFIQPLVENAIRHGISQRAAGGDITVTAQCREGILDIVVRDNGVGLAPDWQPGWADELSHDHPRDPTPDSRRQAGLGLRLTRERLAGFHAPGTTTVTIANHPEGGVQVALRLPLRLKEVAHAAA
ncbi:MAG: histidine kinase [Pseudomonadota bacterium]|nr:histidine kinase [Pseudomonadota bacterium]